MNEARLLLKSRFFIIEAEVQEAMAYIKPAFPIFRISCRFLGGYSFYLAATS